MEIKNKNLVEKLREMEIGDEHEFPAATANSIRATVSNYGFQWDRIYKCRQDREKRCIVVKRIS